MQQGLRENHVQRYTKERNEKHELHLFTDMALLFVHNAHVSSTWLHI